MVLSETIKKTLNGENSFKPSNNRFSSFILPNTRFTKDQIDIFESDQNGRQEESSDRGEEDFRNIPS